MTKLSALQLKKEREEEEEDEEKLRQDRRLWSGLLGPVSFFAVLGITKLHIKGTKSVRISSLKSELDSFCKLYAYKIFN